MRTTRRTGPSLSQPISKTSRLRNVIAPLNWIVLLFTILSFDVVIGRAGLTLDLRFYRTSGGGFYSFYTPLYTNSLTPDAPSGTYIISSPHQPTNGSVRGFLLSTNGISDIPTADMEQFYSDFDSAIFQITNGLWTLQFTNATTTNIFHFTISAPTMTSNMLPATVANFPIPGSSILTNETNFSWQGPSTWPTTEFGQVFNSDSFYTQSDLPVGQTNWNVSSSLPPDPNYTFLLRYLYTNTLFSIAIPSNTVSSLPFAGWDSQSVMESGLSINFSVVADRGVATYGHTLLANYTFEDNNLFVRDSAGGNNMSYAYFTNPPTIVTNDAAAGTYAGGLGGSGWFTPPHSLGPLFTKSFSVSVWLKTTNMHGIDTDDLYSSAGIVSDLGNDYDKSVAPMLQSGRKISFYTGGDEPNLLHSQANINTGQYVHVVTTRDQQTGEKNIYINGVLDSSIFASTNVLDYAANGNLTVGYNSGQVFSGQVDEVQFYSGVLSSNEVAFLHSHPGTNVADVLQLDFPVARYDFEDTNNAGIDTSGHNNNSNCGGGSGTNVDVWSTNAMVGNYARQFLGDTFICFGGNFPNLSNALSADFSVTAWVNTTNSINSDFDQALYGMPVFSAYSEDTNGTIPLSITGSKAAFSIYNTNGTDTTVHSTTSVNDGRYHFIAVTRTRTNGLMRLYVDGVLEASALGNPAPIRTDGTIFIGGGAFNYTGLIDDVRVYGGALAPEDITKLAANGALTFGSVLGTSNILWNTSGDSAWFIETTNTYNGAAAALQSGSVSGSQTSTISATITGPGTLTFVWQNPTANDLDLEFDIDGDYQDDIGGNTDWRQTGPFHINPGQHTLSWSTFFSGANIDTNDAAFLAQVAFIPTYLVAHFDFDNTNGGVLPVTDISGNGNDMFSGFGWNGGDTAESTNALTGARSLRFFKDPFNSFSGGQVGWSPTPPGLVSTLAGSFSVSLWIKTTNHTGTAGGIASDGACIVVADIPGDARDVTPVALSGGKVAFGTGGTPDDDTLTSAKSISDNNWHHVVVTRDQTTGQKRIFIDGLEDTGSPGMGSTVLLDEPRSLSIGTRVDAGFSNPIDSPIYGGYDGLIDDLQIYSRPLSGDEVAFLYAHPGKTVINPGQNIPYDERIRIEFRRNRTYNGNQDDYLVFPFIVSSTPAPITYNEVYSPHHVFDYRTDTDSSSSAGLNSLDTAIQEATNGLWTLVLNVGHASQQTLNFSVSVSGLDTNLLAPVTIYAPTNDSVNVSRTPAFEWSGPTNFETLNVVASTSPPQNFAATLPTTATNWTSAPTLNYGTNQFFVSYVSNTLPLITFTTPMDTNSLVSISNWVATATLMSSAFSTYIVGAPAPLPVHLASLQLTGGNFQFAFASLAGRPHILQGSTNLTSAWVNVTNFVGDGSVQQFTIPRTNGLRFFRVVTQ